jgi:endonuclease G
VAVLPVAAAQAGPACTDVFQEGQRPSLLNPKLAVRTIFLCNEGFAVLVSGTARDPLWSAEHLTAEGLAAARTVPRQGQFHPDGRLPPADQAQLSDYTRSGFDRGHMSPSGDMPTADAQQESFSLSNMVPQVGALNRGIWERLESAVRDLAIEDGQLYVITGPAFIGGSLQSLHGRVLVPSMTWKAIYDPRTGGAAAWTCTNSPQPSCDTASISALSLLIGVDPFPALPMEVKDLAMPLPALTSSPYQSGGLRHHRRRRHKSKNA